MVYRNLCPENSVIIAAGQRGKSTMIDILSCIQYKYCIKIGHF